MRAPEDGLREATDEATKAKLDCFVAALLAMTVTTLQVLDSLETCAATFRKQSRHRQSTPSTGIGRRTVSSAHQQGPARLHVNSVPQPEQARRREERTEFFSRFVMNRAAL